MASGETRHGAALRARVLRRDRDAFADVYAEFGAAVWLVARHGGTDRIAQEITEAVFVAFWRDPEQYDDRGSLGAWLVEQAQTFVNARAHSPDADDAHRVLAALPSGAGLAITMAQQGSTCDQIAVALHTDASSVRRWMREGLRDVGSVTPSTFTLGSERTRPSARGSRPSRWRLRPTASGS